MSAFRYFRSEHEYYPPDLQLPQLVSSNRSVSVILATFFGTGIVLTSLTNALIRRLAPQLNFKDLCIANWFALCK
jgi:hypothetical protein